MSAPRPRRVRCAEVILASEAEAVGELCDDLERMLAGGA
jgi:hypothetical protein